MLNVFGQLLQNLCDQEKKLLEKIEIKHPTTIGDSYEGFTKELLTKATKFDKTLKIVKGFIKYSDELEARSVAYDCLLVRGEPDGKVAYTESYYYHIDKVIAVIEVKKTVYTAELISDHEKLQKIHDNFPNRKFNEFEKQMIENAAYSIHGYPKVIPFEELRERYKNKKTFECWTNASLSLESALPIRILFGYEGFQDGREMARAFVTCLEKKNEKKQLKTGCVPNLIVSNNNSILKLNGLPFALENDKDEWPFMCLVETNPLKIMLALIWTRLYYLTPGEWPELEKYIQAIFDENDFKNFINLKYHENDDKLEIEVLANRIGL